MNGQFEQIMRLVFPKKKNERETTQLNLIKFILDDFTYLVPESLTVFCERTVTVI